MHSKQIHFLFVYGASSKDNRSICTLRPYGSWKSWSQWSQYKLKLARTEIWHLITGKNITQIDIALNRLMAFSSDSGTVYQTENCIIIRLKAVNPLIVYAGCLLPLGDLHSNFRIMALYHRHSRRWEQTSIAPLSSCCFPHPS